MTNFRAAVVQLRGDRGVDGNLDAAEKWLEKAAEDGAELIVLPENFAYYGIKNLAEAAAGESSAEGVSRSFLRKKAKELGVWIVGGTIPVAKNQGEKPFAASYLVSPEGAEAARYDKVHLFDVVVEKTGKAYRESDDYCPGSDVVVANLPWCKLGMSVCYDLRFPELYRQQASSGASVLTAPSAFTAATGEVHWLLLLRARAVENLCFMLAPNMADREHPRRPTWGGSAIIDPWGNVLAALEGEEGFAIADLDLCKQEKTRQSMPALQHRKIFNC